MYATIDIETTGLNRYTDHITFIGIGLTKSVEDEKFFKAYILDMSEPDSEARLRHIRDLIKKHKAKCIFQNGNFDTFCA